MPYRSFALCLALLTIASGCDIFTDDRGEFDATLTGGVDRSYGGDDARVSTSGTVILKTEFSATDGARFIIVWSGIGLPSEGTYPVVGMDSQDVPAESFTARAVLETEDADLRLSAIAGEVTITESGRGLSGTATLTMSDDFEAIGETKVQASFRAVSE